MNNLLTFTVFVFLFIQPVAVVAAPFQDQRESTTKPQKIDEPDTNELFAVVEFSGNKIFSSEELEAALFSGHAMFYRLFKTEKEWLFLPEGTENLREHLERVRFFLGKKGYLLAKFGEFKIERLGEGVIKVLVPIEEGACYRIGQVTVQGSKAITSTEIVEASGLRHGEPINAATIQEKIFKDIEDSYADKGYIQASVDFVPVFQLPYPAATEGIIDVTIEIDEGRLFSIESIQFSGLTKTDERSLLDFLLIHEGQPYSRQKLNETLKRLNQLGIFEEIKDKDVIVRTSDRGASVKLEFQIKELSPQK